MDSYIEITWLFNVILISMCSLITAFLMQYAANTKTVIGLSIIYVIYLMLVQDNWWLIIIGEGWYGRLIFRRIGKPVLIGLAIRVLVLMTLNILLNPSMVGLLWYVPARRLDYAAWALLLFLLFILFLPRISLHFLKTHYIYPVTITIQHLIVKGNGYLDSGNVASSDGIPIVFVSRQASMTLETQLSEINRKLVAIRTLQGSTSMVCYPAVLTIPGYPEREVLIGFMEELSIKQRCDILLNVKVFQVK